MLPDFHQFATGFTPEPTLSRSRDQIADQLQARRRQARMLVEQPDPQRLQLRKSLLFVQFAHPGSIVARVSAVTHSPFSTAFCRPEMPGPV
jgi:hypothetical protein